MFWWCKYGDILLTRLKMHAEGMKLALFYFVQCIKNGQNCLFVREAVALNLSLKGNVCMCAGRKERHENNVSMSET